MISAVLALAGIAALGAAACAGTAEDAERADEAGLQRWQATQLAVCRAEATATPTPRANGVSVLRCRAEMDLSE